MSEMNRWAEYCEIRPRKQPPTELELARQAAWELAEKARKEKEAEVK